MNGSMRLKYRNTSFCWGGSHGLYFEAQAGMNFKKITTEYGYAPMMHNNDAEKEQHKHGTRYYIVLTTLDL